MQDLLGQFYLASVFTIYPARAVLGQGHSGFVNNGLGERRQRRLDLEEVTVRGLFL